MVLSLADYYYFVSNVDILYIIQIKVDQSSDQKIHEKIEVCLSKQKKKFEQNQTVWVLEKKMSYNNLETAKQALLALFVYNYVYKILSFLLTFVNKLY